MIPFPSTDRDRCQKEAWPMEGGWVGVTVEAKEHGLRNNILPSFLFYIYE
jgi:hypothetical protein